MISIKDLKHRINNRYILILTSNTNEKNIIDKLIQKKYTISISNNINGKIGLIGEDIVLHLSGDLGISKQNSVGQIAIAFLGNDDNPKPFLTILAGVCWGNSKLTKIGDVLISNSMLSCNIKKMDRTPVKPKMINSCFDISYLTDDPATLFSQETYVSDSDEIIRNELLSKFEFLHGGEMEGFYCLKDNTPWLIIKVVADYGDKLDREKQVEVLPNISPVIFDLLSAHLKDDEFYTEDLIEFRNFLYGNKLNISRDGNNLDNIQINLIEKYSALIDHNLDNYKSLDHRFYDVKKILESFILEVCSNSISHGRASDIKIEFLRNEIKIIDNGNVFDINQLSEENGGCTTDLFALREYTDLVTIQSKRNTGTQTNIYKIVFSDIIRSIVATKIECPISILSFGRFPDLSYDEGCSAFYIDLTKRFMTSMLEGLSHQISDILIKNNKLAFIKVKNDRQSSLLKEFFHYRLLSEPENYKELMSRLHFFE
ncbi:hypothetical protein [Acinetobacter proteolyticus]|uniref:Nucleoside phosphorylase domain-containing protein n=1 Tax=Acinetobacter proteolyticus TaxID=1776741 RepID=A0A2N0WEY7_9GAMM|nr:hypothetical protein [Acinetobacter proteolyticus]PKF33449.1 hypothetical protein CW311_11660 [Acinetobacter proteolyticus]